MKHGTKIIKQKSASNVQYQNISGFDDYQVGFNHKESVHNGSDNLRYLKEKLAILKFELEEKRQVCHIMNVFFAFVFTL